MAGSVVGGEPIGTAATFYIPSFSLTFGLLLDESKLLADVAVPTVGVNAGEAPVEDRPYRWTGSPTKEGADGPIGVVPTEGLVGTYIGGFLFV